MTWWVRTAGDCVWGVGTVEEVPAAADPFTVQSLRGRVGSDFVIVGEITSVGPPDPILVLTPVYAPVRFIIDFDARGTVLREDRVVGEPGPRCPMMPNTICTPPLILRPMDTDG